MSDWLKLHRTIVDSPQFANPIHLKIWIWLLCKAVYFDKNITLKIGRGCVIVQLKRGQLIFGRTKAEQILAIDGSTIYKYLQALQADGKIIIESNNQYSVITITQYNEYQSFVDDDFEEVDEIVTTKEQPKNNQRTTKEQQSNNQTTAEEQPSNNQITHCKKEEEGIKIEKKEKELKSKEAPGDLFSDLPKTEKEKKEKKVAAKKEKPAPVEETKKEICYPFNSAEFLGVWANWKEYRAKEHKFFYKSEHSEQAGLMGLSNLSNQNEQTAIKIIMQSMANGYKGLFPLKIENQNNNGIQQQKFTTARERNQQELNNLGNELEEKFRRMSNSGF